MSTSYNPYVFIHSEHRAISPRELSKSFDTSMFQYPIDINYPKPLGKSPSPEVSPPTHLLPSFLSKPEKSSIFPISLKLRVKDQSFSKVETKLTPDVNRSLLTPAGTRPHHYQTSSFDSSSNYSNTSFNMKISTEESSREESDKRRKPKKRPLDESEKNFYVIRLDLIQCGEDLRTTVMIKNIPNKYTQKILLGAIDKKFANTYDFLYLPIDFKNRCNVGYAFINFVSPLVIIGFVQEFNDKRWQKFNSEKVCQLAYARIQGLNELVSHFQNSSVINQEDNKIKPVILFKP